jgi:hypothetical protein
MGGKAKAMLRSGAGQEYMTDNYVKGLVRNVGQWRDCVRTVVEPTGCDC